MPAVKSRFEGGAPRTRLPAVAGVGDETPSMHGRPDMRFGFVCLSGYRAQAPVVVVCKARAMIELI